MKQKLINSLIILTIIFTGLLSFNNDSVLAATDSGGQNIGVTVDNSLVVVPTTPVIVRSENIAANTLDLVVEVGSGFANETLNFLVTVTNTVTGDITNVSYTQATDTNARTTLSMSGLDPGTDYQFVVKYKRIGGVFSANSSPPHEATTLIDAPVLTSIDNITTEAADLHVAIDPVFVGHSMDFIIEVSGGGSYTIQMTQNVTSANVVLPVDSLDPDTDYTFKVRYARESTTNFSTYSNELSITTEPDTAPLDKPSIDQITHITTSSMDLIVKVDGHDGESLDFVVQVLNKSTGNTISVNFTETPGSDGKVTLGIGGLNYNTEYEFKVKYALAGDSDYSSYSNSKSAKTLDIEHETTVEICFNGVTKTIKESELNSYLNQGATSGPCSGTPGENPDEEEITICHKGRKTLTLPKSAIQAHLDHGDTLGKCPKDKLGAGATDADDSLTLLTITKKEKEEAKEIIVPEEKKSTYEKAAVAGVAAGTTAALASSAIPLFATMPGAIGSTIFINFLELFGIIGRRKEERNWGVVFNSDTKLPIPAVKIVLLDQSGKEMITTYSDKDGRFGFLVSSGTYIMEVFKKDYTLVIDKDHDELYGKVYDGRSVRIGEDHIMTSNIAMKADNVNWQEFSEKRTAQYNSKWAVFAKYFFISIYAIGFFATIVITYFYPSVFNFVILGIYIILFIYRTFFSKKKYGLVETGDGKPVAFAVVNLYDKNTKAKQNFAVTDSVGRYYLLADNGKYTLKAKGQPISGKQFEKTGDVEVTDGIVRKDIIV
jgi:hypothetical protein